MKKTYLSALLLLVCCLVSAQNQTDSIKIVVKRWEQFFNRME
jgi:hypothetical protein